MKDFIKPKLALMLGLALFSSACLNCSVKAQTPAKTKNEARPIVRVTTGVQAVQGWEQGLVRGNPNLARWHWDPIYSYKQGLARVGPEPLSIRNGTGKQSGKAGPSAYQYAVPAQQDSRPQHIPFSDQAVKEVQARYRQPVHVHTDKPIETNVFGQLSNKQTQASILPTNTIATYGNSYKSEEKITGLKYSYDKTSVYGQLINSGNRNTQPAVHRRTKSTNSTKNKHL